MTQITFSEQAFQDLLAISGMQYKQGYYSAEYWLRKTGVDVNQYPLWVHQGKNFGLCILTTKAIRLLDLYFDNRQAEHDMITERSFIRVEI